MFDEEKLSREKPCGPQRPLANEFGFIEIFSGASLVTKELSDMGVVCGPCLDIGISQEYILASAHGMRWLSYLLASKKLKAVMVSPPCTIFLNHEETKVEECGVTLSVLILRTDKPKWGMSWVSEGLKFCMWLSEWSSWHYGDHLRSYLKHLPGWKAVRRLQCSDETRCDSCRFGSPHLKPFSIFGSERLSSSFVCPLQVLHSTYQSRGKVYQSFSNLCPSPCAGSCPGFV